jgi:hypothetical protein
MPQHPQKPFTKKLRFMTLELLLISSNKEENSGESAGCATIIHGPSMVVNICFMVSLGSPNKVTHLMGIYRYINICVYLIGCDCAITLGNHG